VVDCNIFAQKINWRTGWLFKISWFEPEVPFKKMRLDLINYNLIH